jgi:excisionase family DNA binding protein
LQSVDPSRPVNRVKINADGLVRQARNRKGTSVPSEVAGLLLLERVRKFSGVGYPMDLRTRSFFGDTRMASQHKEPRYDATVQDLATVLNVTPTTIRRWVSAGRIPHVRLSPRCIRFDKDAAIRALVAK